jgi:RNA-directed DNA polymerase
LTSCYVHHLPVSCQEQVCGPVFIHDSNACRKGKGTRAASDRLVQFLRRIPANGRRPAWALKLDVAGFFLCHRQIRRSSSLLAERR